MNLRVIYQHEQLNSVMQIKETKLNCTSRKNMRKNSCSALLSCSDKVPCPEFFQSLSMRENCTTHLEHVHRFSLQQIVGRSVGSAGNGVMGWSDWMARLRINAALYACCVSSNTPLWLSSSKHTISSPTLFFSSFCLVQPQTSLNNWPRLYFTAEYCDSVHLLGLWKTNLTSKCLLIMWLELFKL